jgi:uncharacterized cupin superfamily protein
VDGHKPEKEGFGNSVGMFDLLVAGSQAPYHFHRDRESILSPISGEAGEIVEGKETVVGPGGVLLTLAGEKHALANRSGQDFRFLERFTCPLLSYDFVGVE